MAGVICADGHLGYAQPVGRVIAYEKQISISGVGFDIGCGNMAVRLDTPFSAIEDRVGTIIKNVSRMISVGIGRTNEERVEHELLDDADAWRESDMEGYRQTTVESNAAMRLTTYARKRVDSVGQCEQRCGRLKPLFKRPTRALGNRAEIWRMASPVHPPPEQGRGGRSIISPPFQRGETMTDDQPTRGRRSNHAVYSAEVAILHFHRRVGRRA